MFLLRKTVSIGVKLVIEVVYIHVHFQFLQRTREVDTDGTAEIGGCRERVGELASPALLPADRATGGKRCTRAGQGASSEGCRTGREGRRGKEGTGRRETTV